MTRVIAAEQMDGQIHASVEFDDGNSQTVILPSWATNQNLKDEAKRLRDLSDARQTNKKEREDLIDA